MLLLQIWPSIFLALTYTLFDFKITAITNEMKFKIFIGFQKTSLSKESSLTRDLVLTHGAHLRCACRRPGSDRNSKHLGVTLRICRVAQERLHARVLQRSTCGADRSLPMLCGYRLLIMTSVLLLQVNSFILLFFLPQVVRWKNKLPPCIQACFVCTGATH